MEFPRACCLSVFLMLMLGAAWAQGQVAPGSAVILTSATPLIHNGATLRMAAAGEKFQVLAVNSSSKSVMVSMTDRSGNAVVVALPVAKVLPVDGTAAVAPKTAPPITPPASGALIPAADLSSQFKNNRDEAQRAYARQLVKVEGTVDRFDALGGATTGTGPVFFLTTPPGQPKIRVTLIPGLSNQDSFYQGAHWWAPYNWYGLGYKSEFKVEGDILKVRLIAKSTSRTVTSSGGSSSIRHSQSGDWFVLLSKGQHVQVQGTCAGFFMDIRLDSCELLLRQ